uniref:Uncharacterized protein n=1 Tax=Strombidium inclinatum TaxID=197538 RepID=A0A7S3IJM3_9SPIT
MVRGLLRVHLVQLRQWVLREHILDHLRVVNLLFRPRGGRLLLVFKAQPQQAELVASAASDVAALRVFFLLGDGSLLLERQVLPLVRCFAQIVQTLTHVNVDVLVNLVVELSCCHFV